MILVLAAMGPAPLGLSSTGDPRMNAPWTAMGTSAITIPMPVANGLPLGLQLTAEHGQDARVIRTAMRFEGMVSTRGIRALAGIIAAKVRPKLPIVVRSSPQ